MRNNRIQEQDVWNFDETGFRIGCLRGQLVLTHTNQKAVYIADPENRESITIIEAISAKGLTIDPLVIMQGVIFKEKHFDNDLSNSTLLGMSESGYTTDQLSITWLKHFDEQTKKPRHLDPRFPKKRLLLMDGHGSHLTIEFIKYCDRNGIVPFLLPPHATHLLQPLDIGVFQSYKHYHQELLESNVSMGGIDFDKSEFLSILQKMRKLTFKSRVLRSAWAKAGLFPFNPSIVLDQLAVFNPPIPEPERPVTPVNQLAEFDFATCSTPALNLTAIGQYSKYIDKRLQLSILTRCPPTPTFARVIEKRDKAMKIMVLSGELARDELFQKSEAEKEKVRRRSGNRHIQKYGTISVYDGRLRVAARNEAEYQANLAQVARAEAREVVRIAKEVQKVRIQELDAWIVKFSDVGSHYPISYLVRRRSIKMIVGLQERAQTQTLANPLFATETVTHKGVVVVYTEEESAQLPKPRIWK
jgi:hypothetical protein